MKLSDVVQLLNPEEETAVVHHSNEQLQQFQSFVQCLAYRAIQLYNATVVIALLLWLWGWAMSD